MADIRIKDLATTASTTASDDFMAVDGTTNGTRKLSAATPSFATSVTVPGVAGPTSTDLTLAGGSTGASLVLGQGATGVATFNRGISFGTIVPENAVLYYVTGNTKYGTGITTASLNTFVPAGSNKHSWGYMSTSDGTTYTELMRITANAGNLLIGGTTDIPGSGGLKVFGTTAASSTGSGALQVAGGVGVSGAGYFGGSVVGTSELRANSAATGRGWISTIASAAQIALGVYQSGDSANRFLVNGAGDIYWGDGAGTLDVAFSRSAAGTGTFTGIIKVGNTTSASSSTVGALTIGNGSPATNVAIGGGAINAGASVETVGYFRAASGTAISAATGRGVEIGYLTSADAGYITSYDRTGVAWKPLNLQASSFGLLSSGTSSFTVSSSGIANFTNSTASTGVGTGALQVAGGIYAGAASVLNGFTSFNGGASIQGSTAAFRYLMFATGATNNGANAGRRYNVGVSTTAESGSNVGSDYEIRAYDDAGSPLRGGPDLLMTRSTGAATFAGAVAIGNTVNTVSPTSPNRTVTMVIGGVTYYLAAKTTND